MRSETHAEGDGVAAAGEEEVVGILLRQRAFRVEQLGVVVFVRDLERAGEILQADRACEAEPLTRFVDREALVARLARVRVLVPIRDTEVQALVVRPRQRNLVARRDGFAPLRIVDVRLEFVSLSIDPASLHAEAHTRASVGAHIHPGRVDGALGWRHRHVDRHIEVVRVRQIGLHRHCTEVVCIHEPLLERQDLVRRVVVMRLPRNEPLEKLRRELRIREVHVAEA